MAVQTTEPSNRLSPDELKATGNAHYVAGRLDEAIAAYCEALSQAPLHPALIPQLHANLSAAYLARHDYTNALTSAQRAVAADSAFTKAYYRMGIALIELERPAEAITALTTASSLDAKSESIRQALHQAQALQRRLDESATMASLDDFTAVFARLRDLRLRLATLATFWNLLNGEGRWSVFCKFLEQTLGPSAVNDAIPPEHTGPHVSQFDRSLLTALPMDNYKDIAVPTPWTAFFESLRGPEQIELFRAAWARCDNTEQSLIMEDLRSFFGPTPPQDEGTEGDSEPGTDGQ